MKKNLWMMATLILGMAMSVALTSCGDDEEPTPAQQQTAQGDNGNDNGNGNSIGNDQGGDNGGENGGGQGTDNSGEVGGKKYVDLGLPSGTLWATCNVGADSPEDYGLYFAWGETTGNTQDTSDGRSFDWSTYKYCSGSYSTLTKYCNDSSCGYNGFTDNLTELLLEDDAATANWGTNWRMPSYDQFNELFNSSYTTTTEWTTVNGVYGYKITSKMSGYVGNFIFLPAAGYRYNSSLGNAGLVGYYWSRTLGTIGPFDARSLYFGSLGIGTGSNLDRCNGRSVRPVRVSQ